MLLFSVIFIFTKLPGYTNLLQSCFRYTMSQLQSYHQFQLPPIRFSATLQPTSLAGTVLSLIVVVWILCSQICCICRQVEGPSIIYCMHKEFEGRLLLRVQYFWLIVPLGLYFRSSFLEFISIHMWGIWGALDYSCLLQLLNLQLSAPATSYFLQDLCGLRYRRS